MSMIEVLKFGSSVLRTQDELPVAVDEIYRHWRSGCRVLAVVSAFEGVTDDLIKEAADLFGSDCPAAAAAHVAKGEHRTAAQLVESLSRSGIPSRMVEPHEIGLLAQGSSLDSAPASVNVAALERFWRDSPILVLPGFYGVDANGRTALFGRGGSDMSALFLAAQLGARCRLLKDVSGVFDADPASSKVAHRYTALSWATAINVAGPLIQSKALRFAQTRTLPFEVGRPNEHSCTRVGHAHDEWAAPASGARPLRVVLLGCGVVGRGVYEMLKRYPQTFEISRVVVRDVANYSDINEATTDLNVVVNDPIDIVVECFGGEELPYTLIAAALAGGKCVVTANKAVVAAHWPQLSSYAQGPKRQLWYSAAVGGVLPVLETFEMLATRQSPVRGIRASINGTCGVVLDARAEGKTLHEAIALAKSGGFSETDPARDLSGRDSADKLALMINAAFGVWLAPEAIPTRGIDGIAENSKGYKLVARARQDGRYVTASVAPELQRPQTFLDQARGAENRIEIELESGEMIQLCGQGAGRWPTAVSVMGDLHEVARWHFTPVPERPYCPRARAAASRNAEPLQASDFSHSIVIISA
jgi:homoserine dehydrogenase